MRILSLDGGGIRGIIPGQVLVALEQKLQKISGKAEMRIADAFDLIAGTSTGGILTCLYLCPEGSKPRPKFSAQEAVDLYLQNGDNIFDVSVFKNIESLGGLSDEKYSAHVLEKTLKEYLGDLKLSDMLKPCLITAYDITRRKAQFFNSADVAKKGNGWDFYLRDVARATSAAPTYFEPANISALDRQVYPLIDGGVFANNPAMCACVEAFNLQPKLKVNDLKVLSLGTGEVDKSYHYSEAKNWGKLGWIGPVLDVMMSGVSETVDFQIQKLFNSAGCSDQYLRLQLNLQDYPDVDPAMDNASEHNMTALESAGQQLALDSEHELTMFAKMLLGS
ncbi:MAG: patatin-like phospholipase family protein [Chlorobiales bacterium]|nr:patatin-like phospholipase family protein [Chlorobiales bacterium]